MISHNFLSFPRFSQSKWVSLKNKCIIIAVIIRKPEIHLIITVGVEIALSIPILFANSKEVNFNKIKLPITVPKGCEIDCIKLAF